MTCPQCGTENPGTNRFCMKCGAELATPAMAETGTIPGSMETGTSTEPVGTGNAVGSMEPGAMPGSLGAGTAPGSMGAGSTTGPAQTTYASNSTSYGSTPAASTGWRSSAPAGVGTTYAPSQLVGFGPRFLAYLVDWIVLVIVGAILNFIHLGWLVSIVNIGYFVYFWSTTGQTLGDIVMKIKVVRTDGQPLTWSTGIIRYVGFVISAVVILIGLLWVLWDPMKQGWHDKIANTYVVPAQ